MSEIVFSGALRCCAVLVSSPYYVVLSRLLRSVRLALHPENSNFLLTKKAELFLTLPRQENRIADFAKSTVLQTHKFTG